MRAGLALKCWFCLQILSEYDLKKLGTEAKRQSVPQDTEVSHQSDNTVKICGQKHAHTSGLRKGLLCSTTLCTLRLQLRV